MNQTVTIRLIPHVLQFRSPARTSRSVMKDRQVYFIVVWNHQNKMKTGWGEVAPLDGLSQEGREFHEAIKQLSNQELPVDALEHLMEYPSVRFGMEAATLDLENGGRRVWFPGPFSCGKSSLAINGLIWMGDRKYMLHQIKEKLSDGYPCLKLKIGGIDFDEEVKLLKAIRNEFSADELELRLDANGSFTHQEAKEKLKVLSEYTIHSIEQPIPAGQPEKMASLCQARIIPIALDEELIGIKKMEQKEKLLNTIRPQYIIFKPSLIGGLAETYEYIHICSKMNIDWWVTSALESNVGLNILAQFCDQLKVNRVQGLGTGKLFDNNIQSPLREVKGRIFTDPAGQWGQLAGQDFWAIRKT